MTRERRAFFVLFALLVLFPAALFGYQTLRTRVEGVRVIALTANAPDRGGWQPDAIRVNVGERVRLRIAANDVVHGLAIPELGVQVDEILPGHVAEVDFTATRAGRFAFACTRWCSVDHWRMRGVIEVSDPANPTVGRASSRPPLYQQLHVDIDAPHPAQAGPILRASAARGATLNRSISGDLRDVNFLRMQSPDTVWARLRADPAYADLSDQGVWDFVAYLWRESTPPEVRPRGQELHRRDCAACHGERGQGNGPAGWLLPGMGMMHPDMKKGPADFTDAGQMLGASDVLLQGKILRGGMGTGMPEWGSLYPEPDLWAVIAHVRSFVFDYAEAPTK